MIGIIGGYGDVGMQAARMLKAWGKQPLRIGGRNPELARLNYAQEFPQAEWMGIDIEDNRSVESFLNGCKLIVNCAGPSHRTAARVARISMEKGCHHVDAGIDKGLEAMRAIPQNTVVLYAAGATPGLSGLLPRWLAKSFDAVDSLLYYYGALDRFTATAAEDYLAGVSSPDNRPLAAWKNGACQFAALSRKSGNKLPLFLREVTLYPYFDAEAEFVSTSLALRDGEWYIAVDGTHVPTILEGVRAQFLLDSKGAVNRLCTATELDSFGQHKYMNFIIQCAGFKDGVAITRTLLLQAGRPADLTGSVIASAAIVVLEGDIPAGVRPLAEIPDPVQVISRLSRAECISRLNVVEGSVEQLLHIVEGEI